MRKLEVVENSKRQVSPIMNKRFRCMEIIVCIEEVNNEFSLTSEKKVV
jgi:hypothetical protein